MRPTLRQLEYLVAIADTGKFGDAAKRLNVSQPSLSTQVADMEAYLGASLVERGRKGALMTAIGVDCVARARLILRQVEDLKAEYPRAAFEKVRHVSEFNETMYRTFVSPWVQSMTNPWLAEGLKWMHPMRTSRYLFSETFNPWMRGVAMLAQTVAKDRRPLPKDHPLIEKEHELFDEISTAIERARVGRDASYEKLFSLLYGGAAGVTPVVGSGANSAEKAHDR